MPGRARTAGRLAAGRVTAGTPRLGLASLDLDHPLGGQWREEPAAIRRSDDLPVTEPAQLRVCKVGGFRKITGCIASPAEACVFTLPMVELADSCPAPSEHRAPTLPVRSFCVWVSSSCWDIFTFAFIIHSLSFSSDRQENPIEPPDALGLMGQLERKAERLCGPRYEDERAYSV